jgi:hypothetical protein
MTTDKGLKFPRIDAVIGTEVSIGYRRPFNPDAENDSGYLEALAAEFGRLAYAYKDVAYRLEKLIKRIDRAKHVPIPERLPTWDWRLNVALMVELSVVNTALAGYCSNKATAVDLRKHGEVQKAIEIELVCDRIYQERLPEAFKW